MVTARKPRRSSRASTTEQRDALTQRLAEWSDGEFLVMDDEQFRETYEEVKS